MLRLNRILVSHDFSSVFSYNIISFSPNISATKMFTSLTVASSRFITSTIHWPKSTNSKCSLQLDYLGTLILHSQTTTSGYSYKTWHESGQFHFIIFIIKLSYGGLLIIWNLWLTSASGLGKRTGGWVNWIKHIKHDQTLKIVIKHA